MLLGAAAAAASKRGRGPRRPRLQLRIVISLPAFLPALLPRLPVKYISITCGDGGFELNSSWLRGSRGPLSLPLPSLAAPGGPSSDTRAPSSAAWNYHRLIEIYGQSGGRSVGRSVQSQFFSRFSVHRNTRAPSGGRACATVAPGPRPRCSAPIATFTFCSEQRRCH